jgi:hypothetical protein
MIWNYKDKEFTSDMIEDYIGFVYCVTDLANGKKYIGKKNFWSIRKLPPLKGKTRRRTKKTESDWMKYYGSSEEVKTLVEQSGGERFKREILRLCQSKGEMNYMEMYEQVTRNVLFRDDYYNEFIGVKIHSKHVASLKEEFNKDNPEV